MNTSALPAKIIEFQNHKILLLSTVLNIRKKLKKKQKSSFVQNCLKLKPNWHSNLLDQLTAQKLDILLALSFFEDTQVILYECAYFWEVVEDNSCTQNSKIYDITKILVFFRNLASYSLLKLKLTSSRIFLFIVSGLLLQ